MRTARIAAAIAFAIAGSAQAQSYPPLHVDPSLRDCSIEFASTLTQSAFERFVREFGSVSAYKQVGPAATLAPGRLLLGIEMMNFTVDEHTPAWNDTFAHPNDHHPLGSDKSFPKLNLRAGVTDNLEMGAFFAHNPNANFGWLGLDAKYRLLNESAGWPVSLAARGAYTKTLYVHDMDMHSVTADVSAERTLWGFVRPYLGLGADGVFARETSDAVSLHNENMVVPHVFGGLDVTVAHRFTIGAEFTRGALASTQLQVGAVVF